MQRSSSAATRPPISASASLSPSRVTASGRFPSAAAARSSATVHTGCQKYRHAASFRKFVLARIVDDPECRTASSRSDISTSRSGSCPVDRPYEFPLESPGVVRRIGYRLDFCAWAVHRSSSPCEVIPCTTAMLSNSPAAPGRPETRLRAAGGGRHDGGPGFALRHHARGSAGRRLEGRAGGHRCCGSERGSQRLVPPSCATSTKTRMRRSMA